MYCFRVIVTSSVSHYWTAHRSVALIWRNVLILNKYDSCLKSDQVGGFVDRIDSEEKRPILHDGPKGAGSVILSVPKRSIEIAARKPIRGFSGVILSPRNPVLSVQERRALLF